MRQGHMARPGTGNGTGTETATVTDTETENVTGTETDPQCYKNSVWTNDTRREKNKFAEQNLHFDDKTHFSRVTSPRNI